ncbi:FAD/NAD(P)-binding protein [Bradyrhizobium prioriisuperbiae]|uniref:FAD/NAD(P)-binding protein n=1 Tax=Bradyrhizobium prioriisuperbiae TaxID=2854389 RepID=UPI0028EF085B|nr:FAD/NAD(P)-binding protein [Bradyrhizobium prioritasuperba]
MNLHHRPSGHPTVAIVGGGVSGAAVALFLNTFAPDTAEIVIIEPRDTIGRGLAYSTSDPVHRINVPAARMVLYADDPGHFDRWFTASELVRSDPHAGLPDGRQFPSRDAFGRYIGEQVALIETLSHVRGKVADIVRVADRYRLTCDDGRCIDADIVVLAICHPAPTIPSSLRALAGSDVIVTNPWQARALEAIDADARALIVGTGLTMADIVATLDRQGHRGTITAISRRGQRAQTHATTPQDPYGDFLNPPPSTATALLREIRRTLAQAATEGLSWHAVLDQVRLQGSSIWQALPVTERQRLLHHLRPFWDTHRFRLAPQVHAVLERLRENGQLALRAAAIQSAARGDDGLRVTLRDRRTHETNTLTVDRIILATGPAHGSLFHDDPLLHNLQQNGLASPDVYGLGIAVDHGSRVLSANGQAQHQLFVAGPLARGTFGELMGVPDVARQAERVATAIASLPGLNNRPEIGARTAE